MNDPFKSGDLVRLKSGGPVMVVVHRNAGIWFECSWFDATGAAHSRSFRIETLKAVP